MSFRNSNHTYGGVARSLHWVIALLILLAYVIVYCAHFFTVERTPSFRLLLQQHTIIGIVTLVLVVFRLWWRLTSVQPEPEPGSRLEHLSAHVAHGLLYLLMICTPLTGWLGYRGRVNFWGVFSLPRIRDTGVYELVVTDWLEWTWEEFEGVMDWLHMDVIGGWLLWMLVVVHAAAALYHHFVRRDQTLRRMLGPTLGTAKAITAEDPRKAL